MGLGEFGILFQKSFKQFDQEIFNFLLLRILKPITVSQCSSFRLNSNNDISVFENGNSVH